MFNQITDVPVALRDFYTEVTIGDTVSVELNPKGELKTLDDVWRVAECHKGKNDAVVKSFLAMYSDSLQWQWHDDVLAILDTNALAELPKRPAIIDSEGWFLRNYSQLRQCAYPSYNDQFEMQYDDVSANVLTSQSAWRCCIDAIKAQYPKDTKA